MLIVVSVTTFPFWESALTSIIFTSPFAREERWEKRLGKAFAEYGLIMEYYGIYPIITDHKGGNDLTTHHV